ncbi:MAG: zf-HC2 domain-containing protein [Gemmatimonadaceae bacterium]|nr:zf-HC2 domain-containing protein [Gemmatimonadaceae bacterium]
MRRLFDFLDGELADADDAALRAHLAECRDCLAHAEFERTVLAAVAAQRGGAPLPEATRARVMAALEEAGLS